MMILTTHRFWRKSIQGKPSSPLSVSFLTDPPSRAPPQILNVQVGQPVELRVARRINEDYVPPAAGSTRTFSGAGNRLGAPVPPISGTEYPIPGTFDEGAGPSEPRRATRFEVDQSQPTTSIQLRLADGTRYVSLPPSPKGTPADDTTNRMVCRMNLTHTVGDIRNFINA